MQEPDTLAHDRQSRVLDVAWCPGSSACVAVAHKHGVMLWRKVDSQQSPALHSQLASRGAGNDWLSTPLAWRRMAPVTALAWHPEGSLLAAASAEDGGITVWDPLRPSAPSQRCRLGGDVGTQLLRWSPCGRYLVAGAPRLAFCACRALTHACTMQGMPDCVLHSVRSDKRETPSSSRCAAGRTDGKLQLFETLTWRHEMASQGASGRLIDALWSGAGPLPSLILVYSKQLVSLHFTEAAPSLHVQLMALDVPQVWDSLEVSSTSSRRGAADEVRSLPTNGHLCTCGGNGKPVHRAGCSSLLARVESMRVVAGGGRRRVGLEAQSLADRTPRGSCVLRARPAL